MLWLSLLSYLSGLLLGPAGFLLWVVRAAFPPAGLNSFEAGKTARSLIGVLMAGAGLLAASSPGVDPVPDSLQWFEGTALDGPWKVEAGYGASLMRLRVEEPSRQVALRIRILGPASDALRPGSRVRLLGRNRAERRGRIVETRSALIRDLGEDPRPLPARMLGALRRRLQEGLARTVNPETEALASAMLLGLSERMSRDLKDLFRRTGTSHLMAISGLHLGLLYLMARRLLLRMGLEERWAFPLLAVFLFAYTLLIGCRIPAARACLVCLFHGYGARLPRRTEALDALAAAALALVLVDAGCLADPSFQLSFAGYGAILLLLFFRGLLGTRFGREATRNPPSFLARQGRRLSLFLAVSAVSWLGTLPLVLYYFQAFNPWTPLFNAAVFPLFLAALGAGAVHLAAGAVGLGGSLLTAWPLELCCGSLRWVLARLASLPPGSIHVPAPSAAAVAGCYAAAALLCLLAFHRRDRDPATRT